MTFTAEQIEQAMVAAGVPPVQIAGLDSDVYCPPLEEGTKWVQGSLGQSVQKALFSTGIEYIPERFDCDNFSFMATAIAQLCWATTKGAPEAGLAFGLFGYVTDGHCICFAMFHDNGNLVMK